MPGKEISFGMSIGIIGKLPLAIVWIGETTCRPTVDMYEKTWKSSVLI